MLINELSFSKLVGISSGTLTRFRKEKRILPSFLNPKAPPRLGRVFYDDSRIEEVKAFHHQAIIACNKGRSDRCKKGMRKGILVHDTPEKQIAAIENRRRKAREIAANNWKNSSYFRLVHRLRARIGKAIFKSNGQRIAIKTERLVGCTMLELRAHFQSLFKPGMAWENAGHGGWVIDHKIPCSKFNLTIQREQRKCFHFSNLQPLWEHENRAKGNRLSV